MQKMVGFLCSSLLFTGVSLADEGKKCVALRGNGHYVAAHFGGLARVVEDHGVVQGLAGGSSSTLTAFLYYSILENPAVKGQPNKVKQRRVALLLKSVYGLMDQLKDRGLGGLALLLGEMENPQHRELLQRLILNEKDALRSAEAYEFQHNIADVVYRLNIINRHFIRFAFDNTGGADFHRSQAVEAIQNLSSFRVSSPVPLVRPGVFNFDALGPLAGRLADFFAQRGFSEPRKQSFNQWLSSCDAVTAGLSWSEITNHTTSKEIIGCAYDFYGLAMDGLREPTSQGYRPMHLENLGTNTEVLIGTGIIAGPAAFERFFEIKNKYLGGEVEPRLDIVYEDLRFGYWGSSPDLLSKVEAGLQTGFADDEKSNKFLALTSAVDWSTVLRFSPAEPGLSSALVADWASRYISIGGWSDLQPVQVLAAAGCDEIYYLTRVGNESDLPLDMVKLFNGGQEHLSELFDLPGSDDDKRIVVRNPNVMSSYERALKHVSGGVLCTNWNDPRFSGGNIMGLGDEGYTAKMIYPASNKQTRPVARLWEDSSESVPVSCRAGL